MKQPSLLVLLPILLVVIFPQHSSSEPLQDVASTTRAEKSCTLMLTEDASRFHTLLEKNLAYREQTVLFYQEIEQKIKSNTPLAGSDLERLNSGLARHLGLREELYQAAYKYKCWLEDPLPEVSREERLQGVLLSLSTALALYDNYLVAFSLFQENERLRRYVNAEHTGYNIGAATLIEVSHHYNSLSKRQEVKKAITFFQEELKKQSAEFKRTNAYFIDFIEQSPSYNSTIISSPFYTLNKYGLFLSDITADSLVKFRDEGVNLFSLLFGNTVGLVQTRTGYLYKDSKLCSLLAGQLKAGDILLEKTPFRLTDKLIPGYWGHVAIWLGTEKELRALGIWEHPAVIPYQRQIKEGKQIIEALRSGVSMNPLGHFLNIDDLAILRHRKLDRQALAQTLIRAFRQVGKPYDFNFDIESNDRIVCSELIYVAYTNIKWPTEKTLGRFTVSPTHIAEKTGPDAPFTLVTLYLNGKAVTKNKSQAFRNLL